jgi:Xaa-Pro aminopeptidase
MNKFERAQKILQDLNLDGWLIICKERNDIHSRFMLGVDSPSPHFIYISADGNHQVVAVAMEAPMVSRKLKARGVHAKVEAYRSGEELKKFMGKIIKKDKIALNFGEDVLDITGSAYADFITAGTYNFLKNKAPDTKFSSAAPIIYELRSVKSNEELIDMRQTCKATLEILETVPDWAKIGMTEREIKAKIEYEYMKIGKPSFDAIVGTGANAADPHHNTSKKKIENGPLLIDTGLQIDEMCSDITWTYWVGNRPSDDFLDAYRVLLESKKIANKYMVDGEKCNTPAKKCRECIRENGYDDIKLFFHSLGHSLGFVAHDIGYGVGVSRPDEFKLRENMVYTNEPGLYWAGEWGIRLEDDIIIKKEKCEQITYIPEEPLTI